MGCNTVGFVLSEENDPFKIWKNIKESIFNEIKRETGIDSVLSVWGENFTMPSCAISDFAQMLNVSFHFAGESREMSVHLDCHSDYSEYKKGKKIIVSLGAWGRSTQLIKVVIRGLSEFGEAHFTENDCEEIWQALATP